jgi:hypothetical protein
MRSANFQSIGLTGLTDHELQSRTWLLTIHQDDRTRAAAKSKVSFLHFGKLLEMPTNVR